MEYICFNHYKGKSLSGDCNIHYGKPLELREGILYYEGKPICFVNSKKGHEHFCRNDDGMGLDRGRLIYALVVKRRDVQHDDGYFYRFSKEEIETLIREYGGYLKQEAPVLFGNNLYTAKVEELSDMAKNLNIKVA